MKPKIILTFSKASHKRKGEKVWDLLVECLTDEENKCLRIFVTELVNVFNLDCHFSNSPEIGLRIETTAYSANIVDNTIKFT